MLAMATAKISETKNAILQNAKTQRAVIILVRYPGDAQSA